MDACGMYGLPCLPHRDDTRIRSNHVGEKKECHVWKAYREDKAESDLDEERGKAGRMD